MKNRSLGIRMDALWMKYEKNKDEGLIPFGH